jgi:catechol 2,3-dioxygenase-like lactoylglutathione lyase family enzyme
MVSPLLDRPVIFLATSDPERSRAFYEGTLGLRFVRDDGHALVFDLGNVPLRIQKVDEVDVVRRTVLGWSVPDIEAVVSRLEAEGVELERYPGLDQDANGVWLSPGGTRVAWFKDPDGNTLSLAQS